MANHLIYNNQLKIGSPEIATSKLDIHYSKLECYPIWLKTALDAMNSVVFINTDSCLSTIHKESNKSELSWSRHNVFEIQIVHLLVDALIRCGIEKEDIGIISPYSAQVMLLIDKLSYLK